MQKEEIKNLDALVMELCHLYTKIKNEDIDLKAAKEMNDTANRIIGALKVKVVFMELQTRLGAAANTVSFLSSDQTNILKNAH